MSMSPDQIVAQPTDPIAILNGLFDRYETWAKYAYEAAINTALDTEDDPDPGLQDEERDRWLVDRVWCIALSKALDFFEALEVDQRLRDAAPALRDALERNAEINAAMTAWLDNEDLHCSANAPDSGGKNECDHCIVRGMIGAAEEAIVLAESALLAAATPDTTEGQP